MWKIFLSYAWINRYLFRLKVDRPTLDLPVTEAGRIGAAAPTDLGRRLDGDCSPAAFLSLA